MGRLRLPYKETGDDDQRSNFVVPSKQFGRFNRSLLGIEESDAESLSVFAGIFDLQGFTTFATQPDPHLYLPEFLDRFLDWLFAEVANTTVSRRENDNVYVWTKLPFYAKFLGDGLMFLWDTRDLRSESVANIVVGMHDIVSTYPSALLPTLRREFSKPPVRLRCGMAQGQVVSIGRGADYVGPCINLAARLQKLATFSFAFSKLGLDLHRDFYEGLQDRFLLVRVAVRGVGDEELVYVARSEFDQLPEADRRTLTP